MKTKLNISDLENKIEWSSSILINELKPPITKFITSNGGNVQDAQDILNDSLIILLRNIRQRKVKADTDIHSYVFALARNEWGSKLRKAKKRKEISTPPSDLPMLQAYEAYKEETIITELYDILTIKINKNWSAREMGILILQIDALYQAKIYTSINTRINHRELNKHISTFYGKKNYLYDSFPLVVRSINYNSPGSIDLFGIGEFLKQVKEFILEGLKFKQNYKLRDIEIDIKKTELQTKKEDLKMKKEELKSLRIDNVKKFLYLSKEAELPIATLNKMTQFIDPQNTSIVSLLSSGKIESIEIEDE